MGALSEAKLPALLLGLAREGFDGWVRLSHGSQRRDFQFVAGGVARVDTNVPEDSLAPLLQARDALDASDCAQVAERVAGGAAELAAIAALRKVAPKDLLTALQDQVRTALGGAVAWNGGEFTLEPGAPAESPGPALDLRPVMTEVVAKQLEPHQVLGALGDQVTRFPTLRDDAGDDAFLQHPAVVRLAERLHGDAAPFALLRDLPGAESAAALLVLDAAGLLTWTDTAPATPEECEVGDATAASGPGAAASLLELELEIEVVGRPDDRAAAARAGPSEVGGERDDAAQALIDEVLALHQRLADVTHYEILGVEPDAKIAQIRRAYLKLAKRLHPDAISRLGIDEIKTEANAVFARIGEANQILSDADERMAYDSTLAGEPEIDLQKVAQAESLYTKGEMLMKAGSFQAALELLVPAIELWPEEADYQGAVGWCLFKKNPPEHDRALAHLQLAAQMAPKSAIWPFRLHMVLRDQGKAEEADAALRAARSIDPDVA